MNKKIYHSTLSLTLSAFFVVVSIFSVSGQSVLTNSGGMSIAGSTTLTVVGSVENNAGGIVDEIATTSAAVVSDDITNNGTIAGRGIISLNGDWFNNNTFNCYTGTVNFLGASQLLSGSVSSTFYNLNLDISGIKTQTIDQTTTNILDLNSVELATASFTMFVTNPNTAAIDRVNGFVSSTVGGALSRVTNSAASYLFPTGSSAGTARYRPVALTPANATANTYEVRMANYTPTTEGFNVNTKEAIICQVNPLFFHMLNHTAGAALTTVNVYYDNTADGSWDALGNWLTAPAPMWYEIPGSSTAVGAPLYVATAANQTLPASERAVALSKHALTVNLGSDYSICAGASTTLNAGNAGATYNWSTSAATQTISVSASGIYTVTVTNPLNGCQTIDAINISINALPAVSASASLPTICTGNNTTITAGGATSYSWSGLGTNPSYVVNPAATTTYTVTGTDGNGCTNTANVTVTVNSLPAISASAADPDFCISGSTTITAGGGTSYNWSGLGTNVSYVVNPAATTVYSVTGTDGNGCTNTANVTVTVYPQPPITATANFPSLCVGETTPITGGGGSSYVWDNGLGAGTTFNVTPAATTTYNVTGTDVNGCTNTATVTVSITTAPAVTANASQASICTGASTTLTGGGALNYTWDQGLGIGGSFSVSPGATTTYHVTGTSATGCSATSEVTITVNPIPTITASVTVPTICAGGSTTISAAGGATYNWSSSLGTNSSYSVSPAATITYTVTGTSAAGCPNTSNITVTVNNLPTITASAVQPSLCIGSGTTISAGGGSSYTWDNGLGLGVSHLVTPAATTTYQVTGTDGNGCTNTNNVTVTVNTLPAITATAAFPSLCIGENTLLTGGGGNTYTWDNGLGAGATHTVTPAATTTYNVTGTDGNGCTNIAAVTVTIAAAPAVTASANDVSLCVGSSAILTGGGALNYTWDQGLGIGGSFTVSPAATTTYNVTGSSASGCSATASVTVTVNNNPSILASTVDAAICNGNSTTISAAGGTSYNWSSSLGTNASYVVNPASTTTYSVTGTDGNGCSNTSSITVTVNNLPAITANATDLNLCTGETTGLTAGGGNTYSWDNGLGAGSTQSVTPAATTTYNVTGTDVNGCSNVASVTVSVASIVDAAMNPAGPYCTYDANVLLTAINAGGTWSGSGIVNPATGEFDPGAAGPGTFEVVYTTGGACPDSDTMDIVVNGVVSATINTAGPFCEADAVVTLTAMNAGGTWDGTGITNPATGTFDPSVSGVGSFEITYAILGLCPDFDTVQIQVNAQSDASIAAVGPYCDNAASVTLTGADPGGSWSGAGITNATTGVFDPAVAGEGSHEIIYTIAGACGDTDTTDIVINESPTITVSAVGETCFGANDGYAFVDISGGTAPYDITWENSETTDTVYLLTPGDYDVTISDANGCLRVATGTVDVSGDSCYTPHVFIPNIFSPNGDANNDVYLVQGKGINNYTIRIYDRWGEKVFESEDLNDGWNGEFQGKPVEQGAYPYAVTLIFDGETTVREYTGYITIVR